MLIIKCVILCILELFVPFLCGNLITYNDTTNLSKSPIVKYILGYFSMLAFFWILCVPMSLLKISFTVLCITYSISLICFCGASLWLALTKKRLLFKNIILIHKKIRLTRWEIVYLLGFLLLLGIQLYFSAFYEATIWSYDDFSYVVRSLDTLNSDHMFLTDEISGSAISFSYKRVLNSWEIYIAYLAKISGFHVTTIAHTIIPVTFLLIAYTVYYYMAEQLFSKRENRFLFMCIISVAFIFGLYSPYSLTFRLLVTLWQGKAVLSVIVIPFLITFLPRAYMAAEKKRIRLYLSVISMAACSFTMMGSGMSIAIYISMLVIISFYKRRFTGGKVCIWGCSIPAVQMLLYIIMR